MVFKKTDNGRWIVKKKFTFAGIVLFVGTLIAFKGVVIATTPEQIVVVLSSFGTFAGWLLSLIFAADITDKKLNGGKYEPTSY